jgi:hypothetical protein
MGQKKRLTALHKALFEPDKRVMFDLDTTDGVESAGTVKLGTFSANNGNNSTRRTSRHVVVFVVMVASQRVRDCTWVCGRVGDGNLSALV